MVSGRVQRRRPKSLAFLAPKTYKELSSLGWEETIPGVLGHLCFEHYGVCEVVLDNLMPVEIQSCLGALLGLLRGWLHSRTSLNRHHCAIHGSDLNVLNGVACRGMLIALVSVNSAVRA